MIKKSFTVKSPDGKFIHSFDSDWYDMTYNGGIVDLENIPVSFDDSKLISENDLKDKVVKMIQDGVVKDLEFYKGIFSYDKGYYFFHDNYSDRFCLEIGGYKSGIGYTIKQPIEYSYFNKLVITPLIKNGCYFKTNDSENANKRIFFFCYR